VTANCEDCVAVLLQHEADVNATDSENKTPLTDACELKTHSSMVNLLLKNKANPNAQSKFGTTPLLAAIKSNNPDSVKYVIEHGANVDECDWNQTTPLHLAAKGSKKEIVSLLIDAGADLNERNKSGQTPLHVAADSNYLYCIFLLVRAGAIVNVTNKDGNTPLHVATDKTNRHDIQNHDLVNFLIVSGANVKAQNKRRITPLHNAACNFSGDTLQTLLDHGADITVKNENESTALIAAIFGGNRYNDSADVLINELTINEKKIDGDTPLHVAIKLDSYFFVKRLLKKGADVNLKNDIGETPLHSACEKRLLEHVGRLFKFHPELDPNVKNANGETALHYAAKSSNNNSNGINCCKFLISKGADVNVQDNQGKKPSDYRTLNFT
jgi:ankyrin repeat protein